MDKQFQKQLTNLKVRCEANESKVQRLDCQLTMLAAELAALRDFVTSFPDYTSSPESALYTRRTSQED